jgi:hypothetical protein
MESKWVSSTEIIKAASKDEQRITSYLSSSEEDEDDVSAKCSPSLTAKQLSFNQSSGSQRASCTGPSVSNSKKVPPNQVMHVFKKLPKPPRTIKSINQIDWSNWSLKTFDQISGWNQWIESNQPIKLIHKIYQSIKPNWCINLINRIELMGWINGSNWSFRLINQIDWLNPSIKIIDWISGWNQ